MKPKNKAQGRWWVQDEKKHGGGNIVECRTHKMERVEWSRREMG